MFSKKSASVLERHLADVGAGEERAPDVDRVRRRRHERGVAGLQQHPHQVAEALLGPDGGDDLAVGVERDAEAAQVEVGHRLAQLRDAPAGRVAVVAGVVRGLGQLLHRDGRRRAGPGCRSRGRRRRPRPAGASIFSPSMIVKTYGGRVVIRRNSIASEGSGGPPTAPGTSGLRREAARRRSAAASEPWVAATTGGRSRCPAATVSSGSRRRVSSSQRSAASISPPPRTTTSGSRTAIRLAMPRAVHQARSSSTTWAWASPGPGGLDHVLAPDGRGVVAHGAEDAVELSGLRRVPGHAGQPGPGRVALPAPPAPTGAGRAVGVHRRVARLPRHPVGPPHQPAADDQPGPDARAEGDQDRVLGALGGARDPLGPHGTVPVVVHGHPVPETSGQVAPHVQLPHPRLVRPVPQHPPVVDQAGHAHPDPSVRGRDRAGR